MKKFTAFVAAAMLTVLAAVPMSAAGAEAAPVTAPAAVTITADTMRTVNTQMYVSSANGKGVNLRAEPSTNAKLLAQLGEGMPVKVIATNNTWSKIIVRINSRNVTGYAMNKFLSKTSPLANKQHFTNVAHFTVTAKPTNGDKGFVNLRSKADTQSAALCKLYKGDKLTVVAESEAWYKVKDTHGHTGYVVKAYVQK